MMRHFAICLLSLTASLTSFTTLSAVEPSPHDGHHLVIIKPHQFLESDGKKSELVNDKESAFGSSIPLKQPVEAKLQVKFSGHYQLWVRVATPNGKTTPIDFELTRKQRIAAGSFGTTSDVSQGGPVAFAAYRKAASKAGVAGKLDKLAAVPKSKTKNGRRFTKDVDDFKSDLLKELTPKKELDRAKWVSESRLENPNEDRPYHWWKLADVELEPGEYQLKFDAKNTASATPVIDSGFLSTRQDLTYPYVGDISQSPASYVRFRIDKLPEEGLSITAALRIHSAPWSTPRVGLNPDGMATKSTPHSQTGFTRWYSLQEIERAPGFGNSQAHLLLQMGTKDKTSHRGATQFAIFPHDDYVLREIPWDDPEGMRISFATNFESNLHLLRTFRDHARENYERAKTATGDRVFPLTRGELYFSNVWGAATGAAAQYMVKTLRLLGMNCVGDASDPVANRKLYGWTSHAGHYWPPAMLPFDEKQVHQKYDDYYKKYFSNRPEFYEGVSIFQIADEPGEISREAMSSPLWRFSQNDKEEKYADVSGGSDLITKKTDYHDCVLEGVVQRQGNWLGFRVAVGDPAKPTRHAEWRMGRVSAAPEMTLAAVTRGIKPERSVVLPSPSARIGSSPTPFKIIYQGDSAVLFVRNKRIHQFTGLPKTGGFAIIGLKKTVHSLKFRDIRKDEQIVTQLAEVEIGQSKSKKKPIDDLDIDGLLGDSKKPKSTQPKSLKETLALNWVPSGGMPQAHAGFREWAKKQGLTPATFGKQSWTDVRMLTVASLVESKEDARLFYWSRRYSGFLTPRMFNMAGEAIHRNAPNKSMKGFVALSGHALYFPSQMPLDMFQLASGHSSMMPGVSDWMSSGGWRWDSHQAVAFSVAMYNAGARRRGQDPLNFPMMHCVWPSEFRAYTMLANQVRLVSYFNYGPFYAVTEGFWSESDGSYHAVHRTNNRAAQVDDILSNARMRRSRVAMLYSISNEYWNPQSSFADKRATFLALSHEYYQPELVTEDQVNAGALADYDALYVLDPIVASDVQKNIGEWVNSGGILWTCANSARSNEFNEPEDLLKTLTKIERNYSAQPAEKNEAPLIVSSSESNSSFRPHTVRKAGVPNRIDVADAKVIASYNDNRPAWLEQNVGQGKVVYIAHRAGLSYTALAARRGGYPVIWADTARELLTRPLKDTNLEQQLNLSQPLVVASPLTSPDGTVIILYNMRPVACQNLTITLKENQKPKSIQYFENDQLVNLPFKYEQGQVTITLPTLSRGQMIVVRHKQAQQDTRIAQLHTRVEQQLSSNDWQTLSAAAWFAGHHPEWNLADRLTPLLSHEHWDVRRSSAEAIGHLNHQPAADKLVQTISSESDSHALGDQLVALARLGDKRIHKLAVEQLNHADAFVRKQAMQSVVEYIEQSHKAASQAELSSLAIDAAEIGLTDLDLRVRRIAIQLIGRFDAKRTIQEATLAFSENARNQNGRSDRDLWATAIAKIDNSFETYLSNKPDTNSQLLLALATRRRDNRLASILSEQLNQISDANAGSYIRAAVVQKDNQFTQKLFNNRNSLPNNISTYLPIILEHTYDARLGSVLSDWDEFLKQNSAIPSAQN